jgi:hypothetical protein
VSIHLTASNLKENAPDGDVDNRPGWTRSVAAALRAGRTIKLTDMLGSCLLTV